MFTFCFFADVVNAVRPNPSRSHRLHAARKTMSTPTMRPNTSGEGGKPWRKRTTPLRTTKSPTTCRFASDSSATTVRKKLFPKRLRMSCTLATKSPRELTDPGFTKEQLIELEDYDPILVLPRSRRSTTSKSPIKPPRTATTDSRLAVNSPP